MTTSARDVPIARANARPSSDDDGDDDGEPSTLLEWAATTRSTLVAVAMMAILLSAVAAVGPLPLAETRCKTNRFD